MESPELSILALNLIIVLVSYLSIYPKLAGNDLKKITFLDILSSGFALLVVGLNYWGSGHEFNILINNVNWFWFTLISYFLMEVPVMLWYFKKQNVKM